jgi:hypothetical protein
LVSTSLGDSGCDRPDAASAIEAYVAVLLDAVIPGAELESIAENSASGARIKERSAGGDGDLESVGELESVGGIGDPKLSCRVKSIWCEEFICGSGEFGFV